MAKLSLSAIIRQVEPFAESYAIRSESPYVDVHLRNGARVLIEQAAPHRIFVEIPTLLLDDRLLGAVSALLNFAEKSR